MKKIIMVLLFFVLSNVCFGIDIQQLSVETNYRIGYSTKYGNSFGQKTTVPTYTEYLPGAKIMTLENKEQSFYKRKIPKDPNDPYMTPIGNSLVLLVFLLIWCIYKEIRNDKLHRDL